MKLYQTNMFFGKIYYSLIEKMSSQARFGDRWSKAHCVSASSAESTLRIVHFKDISTCLLHFPIKNSICHFRFLLTQLKKQKTLLFLWYNSLAVPMHHPEHRLPVCHHSSLIFNDQFNQEKKAIAGF